MAPPPGDDAVIIKKYANRRLYHMGTSTYVTLEDLATMVRAGEDFVVTDAKSGEDITRSVLAQIMFEQENKGGQNLLPTTFLRQLIRFYGHSLQGLVPSYLEFSLESLAREQQKFRDQMAQAFGPAAAFHAMEEQARSNLAFFSEAMRMFLPFARGRNGKEAGAAQPGSALVAAPSAPAVDPHGEEIEALRRQVEAMQAKLDVLTNKDA